MSEDQEIPDELRSDVDLTRERLILQEMVAKVGLRTLRQLFDVVMTEEHYAELTTAERLLLGLLAQQTASISEYLASLDRRLEELAGRADSFSRLTDQSAFHARRYLSRKASARDYTMRQYAEEHTLTLGQLKMMVRRYREAMGQTPKK